MNSVTIEGVAGLNGDYPLDLTYFLNRELHLIKKISGVRAGELEEAFGAGDNDLMVALAAIAVWRNTGKQPVVEMLMNAQAGKFTFREDDEADTEDDDESLPPPIALAGEITTVEQSKDDGGISSERLDRQANDLRTTGALV